MKSDLIRRAVGGIDADLIEAADQTPRRANAGRIWKRAGLAAACLALAVAVLALPKLRNGAGAEPAPGHADSTPAGVSQPLPGESRQSEYGTWYLLPGGIRPELMVNGRLYYWDSFAYPLSSGPGEGVYLDATGGTVLPEGFTPAGELSSVTEDAPAGDGQLKAGFNAAGTVYTNEAVPEAVYVLLDADCFEIKGPYYIRFISEELAEGGRILCNGRSYRIRIGDGSCETVRELPEGCAEAGRLHFVGYDLLPQNELETNCPSDSYGKSLEGRQVYVDPAAPEYLYLHETQYWAGGSFEGYLKCPRIS